MPFASVIAALFLLLAGCADDEFEERDPAFPQQPVVGTTNPQSYPTERVAATQPPLPPPPQPVPSPEQTDYPGEYGEPPQPTDDGPPPADAGYSDQDPSALQDFRGALSPYGNWVDDPTYGTVWVPSSSVVGDDFEPYVSAGHWSYDDDSYVWVSDYDWGWAPFHYGRWVYSRNWEWIPGRRYAGAWVSWRYGVGDWGYVGWAPLAPTWGWRGGSAFGLGFAPRMPYTFCPSGQLFAPHVGAVVASGPQVGAIAANTRPWSGSGLAGRTLATPSVTGPPPSILHIPAAAVVSGSSANRGIAEARAFARPSTAIPLGGSLPRVEAANVGSKSRALYGAAPSHFGGRVLGTGFSGAGAARGYAPRPYYGSYGSGRYGSAPVSRGFSAGRSYAGPASGAYRGAPAHGGGGESYHGGGGGFQGGGGGFHGGGGGGGGGHGGGGHGGGRR